jgi:hypothetical protein
VPKNKWGIAPSDLQIVEDLFSTNGLSGTPMFCWSVSEDRWEVYESTDLDTLVVYLCNQNNGWLEPE